MKIAFLSPFDRESAGTNRLQNFSRCLNYLGHETSVFDMSTHKQLDFGFLQEYEIVHVLKPHYRSGLPAYILRKFGFYKKALLDYDETDWMILEDRKRGNAARVSRFLEWLLTKRFDGVIVGNDLICDYVYGKLRIPKEKIKGIFPNGVDTEVFNPNVKDMHLRELYEVYDYKLITYVGTLASFEQIEPIIRGFKAIHDKHPDTKLLIAGDGDAKLQLIDLADELDLLKYVVFAGRVAHDFIPNLLGESDILIHLPFQPPTARIANPSQKGVEYMSMQKPIIGASVGYADVMFDHGKAAFLIDSPDPQEVLGAYEEIMDNPDEARKRAKYARHLAETRYDWRVLTKKLEKVYEKLLAE